MFKNVLKYTLLVLCSFSLKAFAVGGGQLPDILLTAEEYEAVRDIAMVDSIIVSHNNELLEMTITEEDVSIMKFAPVNINIDTSMKIMKAEDFFSKINMDMIEDRLLISLEE